MSTNENNEGLRVRSGNVVSGSRLAAFLYDLIRDQVPPGIIEEIVQKLPKPGQDAVYTNGWLASYCEDLAKRIVDQGGSQ